MNRNYKVGDIFCFPISNKEFGFGRVLLDPYSQGIKKSLIDKSNAVYFSDKIILVEIFKNTSSENNEVPNDFEVLLPGIFCGNGFIERKIWPIVGNSPVDPEKIDFPEFISHQGVEKSVFSKGEIRIEIPLSFDEAEKLKIRPTSHPGIIFGELVLYNTGRKDEINNPNLDVELRNMANLDLRFSNHRERIYELMSINSSKKYISWALEKGFDLKRFY